MGTVSRICGIQQELWPADSLARLGGGVGRFFWPAALGGEGRAGEGRGGEGRGREGSGALWWGMVGEGEAGKTGPAPWAVLRSRPRSLAAAVEPFQRRVQRL